MIREKPESYLFDKIPIKTEMISNPNDTKISFREP